MQYCIQCKTRISTKTDKCPLCHTALPHPEQALGCESYPRYQPIQKGSRKLFRILSIIAGALILFSALINLLTWNGSLWSALSSACIVYAWGGGLITCSRKVHLGWKLTLHAVAIPLLLILFNTFAYNTQTIHEITWAVSYGMPSIYICFIISINIIMLRWRQKRRDYLLYQLSLCVIGFVPLILVLSGLAHPMWPSIVAAGCSFCTIVWLVVSAKRIITAEFAKRFHI